MDNAKTKSSFDENRKPEPVYPNGTTVVVQEKRNPNGKTGRWKQFGTIVSKRPHGPSYSVDIDGRKFIRSQLFLRPAPKSGDVDETITETVEADADDDNPNPWKVQRHHRRTSKRNRRKPDRYGQ